MIYSVTTSIHQSKVLNAIYGKVVYVSGNDSNLSDHQENLKCWLNQIIDISNKLDRARNQEKYISELESLKLNILEYLELYSNEIKHSSLPKALKQFLYSDISDKQGFANVSTGLVNHKKYLERKEKQRRIVAQQRQKEKDALLTVKLLKKFHNYEIRDVYTAHDIELRLSQDGKNIETSKGVSVPFREGFLLYSLAIIHRQKNSYKNYQNKRVAVGNFNLTFIDKKGNTRVNCHYLTYDNMEKLYNKIQLDLVHKNIVQQYQNLFARLANKLTREI